MAEAQEITDKEFRLIQTHIKDFYGISLGDEKKSLVFARLRGILQKKNFTNFEEYYNYLINDKTGEAAVTFIDKMTTNHTYFMRESDHFEYFKNTILPYLENKSSSKDIRLWCAGCSSGEEPYTLQMYMLEYFANKPGWDTTLLATDISTTVLKMAYNGVYTHEQIKSLPDAWKQKFFKKLSDDAVVVQNDVKSKIIFRRLNLMSQTFPLKKKLDVIFCRNVMIYFDNPTRDTLVQKYYDNLEPGGYLFIGHSETLNYSSTKFKYIMPAVYRKPD